MWLRVSTLADDCEATLSSNNSNVTLPLYAMYVRIAGGRAVVVANASMETVLDPLGVSDSSRTQLPFYYKDKDLILHPLSVRIDDALTLFVYTYQREGEVSIRSMRTSISGLAASDHRHSPVFASSVNGTMEQAWSSTIALGNDTTSSSVELAFYSCHGGGTCTEQQVYLIEVPFSMQDASLSWGLSGWAKINSSIRGIELFLAYMHVHTHTHTHTHTGACTHACLSACLYVFTHRHTYFSLMLCPCY